MQLRLSVKHISSIVVAVETLHTDIRSLLDPRFLDFKNLVKSYQDITVLGSQKGFDAAVSNIKQQVLKEEPGKGSIVIDLDYEMLDFLYETIEKDWEILW